MVRSEPTPSMIEDGAELLAMLDVKHYPVRAFLWVYFEEQDRWKIVLASEDVRKNGRLQAIRTLSRLARRTTGGIKTFGLGVFSPIEDSDPLIRDLRAAVGRGRKAEGQRVARRFGGPDSIADAYIYRLH